MKYPDRYLKICRGYSLFTAYQILLVRRGDHCVKSNIVNSLCKDMVYTFRLRFYAFGSRTERSGGRLPNAACVQSLWILRCISLPVCTSNSAMAKFL